MDYYIHEEWHSAATVKEPENKTAKKIVRMLVRLGFKKVSASTYQRRKQKALQSGSVINGKVYAPKE